MKSRAMVAVVLFMAGAGFVSPAAAADLTLSTGGKVSIELLTSDAAFRNTLSVFSPTVGAPFTGCKLEPADGLPGARILSEKTSQRGCRVTLDADPVATGIQPFAMGTTFQFRMCAQTDADPACEFVWASNPGSNPNGFDHVMTTAIRPAEFPGKIFQLAWEDQSGGGDMDFNDLIAIFRVEADTDGDGLWDDWEQFGVDTTGDGVPDLDLPALGANSMRKNLFVEIDWMDCAVAGSDCPAGDTHSHQPNAAAVTAAVQAFANANVTNPDASTGITLRIDVGNSIPHQNFLIIPGACFSGAAGTGFDAVKNDPANFGPTNPRRFAYHYALFTHRQTSGDRGSSGCAELPGNDFQVSLGSWSGQVGTIMDQAGTLLHEFGHNLNLGHGGGDGVNFKPNYLSVMSYRYQVSGVPPTDPDGPGPLTARMDYSRSALPNLNETNLSEPAGIGDGTDNAFFCCPNGSTGTGVGNAGLDWNCNGVATDTGVSNDINCDRLCVGAGNNGMLDTAPVGDDVVSGTQLWDGPDFTCNTAASGDDVQAKAVGGVQPNPLAGYWDWANLKFDFHTTSDFEDGFHMPQAPELDRLTFLQVIAADLSLTQVAAPTTVVTDSNVTYTITIKNKKSGAAQAVTVTDNLPASTTFVSCGATAGGVCGGAGNNRTVTFATLAGGASATITLVAKVNCNVPNGTSISNTASVSFSTTDPDPSDNSATTTITASNPPPVISNATASPAVLWPPNHTMRTVDVNYTVTDNCGTPICTLGVTSDEPIEGTGDGDAAPDWEVINANRVRLRAERAGSGDGRVYTIAITCQDSGGGASSRNVTVSVPHSQTP